MADAPLQNKNVFQSESGYPSLLANPMPPISIRCPHCRHLGSFGGIGQGLHYKKSITPPTRQENFNAQVRLCPNPGCNGLVFTVMREGTVASVQPPELIEISTDNLPSICQVTLVEAAACHAAGAYRASAMMVRRLLEELCELNGASGANLHQRIESLRKLISLPEPLFEAMAELKALGNDATHVQAKSYDDIGRDESADAIELACEILKSLYQLKGLVERLQKRKV
ncbi:MAG: DUF4145 domain-containing protein [Roseiarcus sp.]|jgi:hypothetical protein